MQNSMLVDWMDSGDLLALCKPGPHLELNKNRVIRNTVGSPAKWTEPEMKSSDRELRIVTVAGFVVVVLQGAMMVQSAMEPTTMVDKSMEPTAEATAVPVQVSGMPGSVSAVGGEITHEPALAVASGWARDGAAVIKSSAAQVAAFAKAGFQRLQAVMAPLRDRLVSLFP